MFWAHFAFLLNYLSSKRPLCINVNSSMASCHCASFRSFGFWRTKSTKRTRQMNVIFCLNLPGSPVKILFIPVPGHQKIHPKGGAVFHPDCLNGWCHCDAMQTPLANMLYRNENTWLSQSWMSQESNSIVGLYTLHCSVDWTNDSFSNALMVALHVITFAPDAPASWKRPKAWAHSLRHSHCKYCHYGSSQTRWNFMWSEIRSPSHRQRCCCPEWWCLSPCLSCLTTWFLNFHCST